MAKLALNFKKVTTAAFTALSTKAFGTFYLVTDDGGATGELYMGEKKITNAADLSAAISRIGANEGDIDALQTLTEKLDGEASVNGSVRNLISAAVSDINGKMGELPAGNNLVSMINAGDSAVTALESKIGTVANGHTVMGDVAANASAIETLNGDATVAGSVDKKVAEAIAAVVASAPTDFDTLKEIAEWISSHASSAADMNSRINANTSAISANASSIAANASAISANASAISAHETFVGASLPAATSATTVIGYVTESFEACNTLIGEIPAAASASTVVDYVQEVVTTNQLYWSED